MSKETESDSHEMLYQSWKIYLKSRPKRMKMLRKQTTMWEGM